GKLTKAQKANGQHARNAIALLSQESLDPVEVLQELHGLLKQTAIALALNRGQGDELGTGDILFSATVLRPPDAFHEGDPRALEHPARARRFGEGFETLKLVLKVRAQRSSSFRLRKFVTHDFDLSCLRHRNWIPRARRGGSDARGFADWGDGGPGPSGRPRRAARLGRPANRR